MLYYTRCNRNGGSRKAIFPAQNMYKAWIKKYGGWFILGLLLIASYKLFDELLVVSNWFVGIVDILQPFLIGAVLAYLLYIPANALEKRFLRSSNENINKRARLLAVLVSYFAFLLILVGVIMYLIPIIRDNVTEISDRWPSYNAQVEQFFNHYAKEFDLPDLYSMISDKVALFFNQIFNTANLDPLTLISHGVGIVNAIFSWLMAIVVCPYILFERDHLLSIFDRLMLTRICERDLRFVHRYAARINRIFSDFIFGKALDSLVIGVISYVAFALMGLKFDLLLALVIMVTNMIPYFGPFIGGIPVVLITALTTGVSSGFWTAIFIVALQQFDGLLLGPYILGESVGVSALWIIFAITFFGGTMGFIGMVIGVPLIAVIRMLFNDLLRYHQIKQTLRKSQNLDHVDG